MERIKMAMALALLGMGLNISACAAAGAVPLRGAEAFVDAPSKTNGTSVRTRYRVDHETSVGQAVAIDLQFAKARDGATVRFAVGDGLGLESPAVLSLPSGSSEATVVVRPLSLGRHYLNVFIAQGGRLSAISIPVQVGPRSTAQKVAPAANDDEDVIVMPVD